MKTATFPSLRVDAALRKAAEEVLGEGETLSSFIEQSVRAGILRRQVQAEFIARGLASRDKARQTGVYVSADDVIEGVSRRLAHAKARSRS